MSFTLYSAMIDSHIYSYNMWMVIRRYSTKGLEKKCLKLEACCPVLKYNIQNTYHKINVRFNI